MKYLLLGPLLFLTVPTFAQISRAYLTAEGKYTSKPKKAASYVLIEKLEDSAYFVREYDMTDTIMLQGTFKDQLMTIPNGKFLFYHKTRYLVKDKKLLRIVVPDTNNYLAQVGYFLNGSPNGTWIRYSSRGVKGSITNYENGKLNGLYQSFLSDYIYEGHYVNNLKEGNWHSFRTDTNLLLAEAEYHHDTLKSEHIYWNPAKERFNLNTYLRIQLKKYVDKLKDNPVIKYTINKEGQIVSPEIVKGISPEIDAAIITALHGAERYYPATYDYLPVEQKITRTIQLIDIPTFYAGPTYYYGTASLSNFNSTFNEARKYIYIHQNIVIGSGSPYTTTIRYGTDNLSSH